MTTAASRIGGINLVMVPSTDQDRSVEFYESALDFEKRTDVPFGEHYRSVEVYPPSGTTGIALAPPREGDPTGVQTGISLTTDDIEATHAHLRSRGVDVDPEILRMGEPVPPMFWFRDPDGNTLLIVDQGRPIWAPAGHRRRVVSTRPRSSRAPRTRRHAVGAPRV